MQNFTRFSLLLLVIFTFTITADAQWIRQSPYPTHLHINGIAAPAADRVFISTSDNPWDDGGALFESTNGGDDWVQRNIPINLGDGLNGIFFIDSQNGWVYGNDNYRTTDGGTTWTQLPFLGSTSFMKFYTQSFGIATGNFGRQVSYDGGLNWTVSPNDIFSFHFIGNTGLGISNEKIFRTTDGGNTLTEVFSGNVRAAVLLSESIAAGIANNSYIRSTDGGLTWVTTGAVENRNQIVPVNADIVLSWNRLSTFPATDGRMSRSTDGGQTWTDLGVVVPEGIFAFSRSGTQNIIVSDIKGNMFLSSDAGENWVQTFSSPGPIPGLNPSTPVFSGQTGYFAYGFGFIIKTTDGGSSWFQISSGTGETINDLGHFADGNMLAVGEKGTVLTGNGLTQWVQQNTNITKDLTAVQVLDSNHAVAVDNEGQIYVSSDKGVSWTASGVKPSGLSAKDIHFHNLLEGWIIGSGSVNGALRHTTDGGNTWTAVPDINGSYVAVDFKNGKGWALSAGERFYRSTDNGANWIMEELPGFPLSLSDMEFFDGNTGYAVGWFGYAARTNDGGVNWQVLPTPNATDRFTDIHIVSAEELWVSTNDGKVYHSATGGLSWAVLDVNSEGFGSFHTIIAGNEGGVWTAGYQGYIEYNPEAAPPPQNQPPVANYSFTAAGLTLQFTDLSTDPDGSIISWLWSFGDSSFSNEKNPSHTFPAANTYHVMLTVMDDDSATSSKLQFIVAQPGPGGVYGNFTEVTPIDSIFVTSQFEDFWVITTAPADYDGDGDLDIAVMGYYVVYGNSVEDKLLLLRNEGPSSLTQWNFTYIDVPLGDIYTGASDLAWGDLDGDGDLDLIVGSSAKTVIYNNEAGTLILSDTELPGYWEDNFQADFDLHSISTADYDNDGDLDILLPSVYDTANGTLKTVLLRNEGKNSTGGWVFTEFDSVFAPTAHAQSFWADNDNDQDLDLLLVNIEPLTDKSFIRIYTNEGNGVFTGEDILGAMTIEHGEAQWGDYDGDGDLDILITGHIKEPNGSYNMVLRIYRNDAGSYTPLEVIDCVNCLGWFDLTAAAWADYDSDGDMDILLAGTYNSGSQIEGRARIYTNNNGIFTESGTTLPAPRASGSRGGTFSWLDIDSDGDLDYFIAGQYFVPGGNNLIEAQMHLYRNDAEGLNNAPTIPENLSVTNQPDNSVLLSWDAAVDDHTPSIALTYDLNLFRNDIPVTIPDRLPEPGNISTATNWLLSGLEDGHYKWTVRAVDAAYIGSPVASGQFSIGITGINESNMPFVYSLDQNYPNPFNPNTIIKYSVASEGLVTLKIYNTLGEEVATLLNEVKPAGNHEAAFNAANLSSSVYLYQLRAGDYVETRKMVLIK